MNQALYAHMNNKRKMKKEKKKKWMEEAWRFVTAAHIDLIELKFELEKGEIA
jgi:hypothetical protein